VDPCTGADARRAAPGRAAWLGGTLLLLGACAGQKTPPLSAEIDETGYRDAVRVLASDDFEGRAPGTPGEDKTVAYLVDRFRKLGLKPGNGDSYLQSVPLTLIRAGSDASLVISGHGATKSLEYVKDMVIWTRGEAPDAVLQRSALMFVGFGIVAPEYQWNDYAGVDVHGKTVVVLAGDPGHGSRDPKVFRGNALTNYGLGAYKIEEAARQGAAGVLLIHDTGAAGFVWSAVVNGLTGLHLATAAADGGLASAAIEGWLSGAAARGLFAQAGVDYEASTAAASRPGFAAIDLGLAADAQVHNTLRRFSSSNVIAVLPGARRKNEYVIYSAHWDHLGRQPVEAGGAVFNGAVDNASGVAGLLMLAQSFKRTQPPPDRSLVFIAFTGEEAGLLGSGYYTDHPVFPMRQTVAALNLDQMHIGGPTRDVTIFGYGNSELDENLREAAQLQGREVHPDPVPELGLYYRSDQLSFARAGVPALYAQGGLDDSARGPAWGRAQLEDYLSHRYRQTTDRYSADWDVRGALEDLRLYYDVGNRLSRSRRFPRWYPNSEFRMSRHQGTDAPGP
jgi:Zn-dependent M28 family amino/carboxypeptidase